MYRAESEKEQAKGSKMLIENRKRIKREILGTDLLEAKKKYLVEALEYKKNQLAKAKKKISC